MQNSNEKCTSNLSQVYLLCGLVFGGLLACQETDIPDSEEPVIEVNPLLLDFGVEPLANKRTKDFVIGNSGTASLFIKSIDIVQENSSFQILDFPVEIVSSAEKTVTVQFQSSEEGLFTAKAFVVSNAANNGMVELQLKGEAVATQICGDCQSPPTSICVTSIEAEVYDEVGTCSNNQCRYERRRIPCAKQCLDGSCVGNRLPVVSLLWSSPIDSTETDLAVRTSTSDPDGDRVTVAYRWYKNEILVENETNAVLSSELTRKNELWRVIVTPGDGQGLGAEARLEAVIPNSPPVVTAPTISPSNGVASTVFTCVEGSSSDADEDSVRLTYQWRVNGRITANTSSISALSFRQGDSLVCEVTPNDGEVDGQTQSSRPISISNSAPSITAVSIGPSDPNETTVITPNVMGWRDLDGHAEQYRYDWLVNGMSVSSGSVLTGQYFDRGDTIEVVVTPFDGFALGTSQNSNQLTVSNAPGVLTGVSLRPNPGRQANFMLYASTTDELVAEPLVWSDPDGDSATYRYEWFVNSTTISAVTTDILASNYFVRGDEVEVQAWGFDGLVESLGVRSSPITISNTAPSIPCAGPCDPNIAPPCTCATINLRPYSGNRATTFMCTPSGWEDVDGDSPYFTFEWFVDNSLVSTSQWFSAATITRGTTIYCQATPYDGYDFGSPVGSANIQIENAPPVISSTEILPNAGDESTVFTCSAVGWDDLDGDPPAYFYSWRVNSQEVSISQTLSGTNFNRGDEIDCTITPYDGFINGAPLESSKVLIGNHAPSAPTATVSVARPVVSQDVVCSVLVDSTDLDNDAIDYSFVWTNGTITSSGAVLSAVNTSANEAWTCTVTPNDGREDGQPAATQITVRDDERCGLVFDGSSSYLDMGSINLDYPLTLEAWLKPSDLASVQTIMSNTDTEGVSIRLNDCPGSTGLGRLCSVHTSNSVGVSASSTVTVSDWIHVATTYDGNETRIYINGVMEDVNPLSGSVLGNSFDFLVGAQPTSNLSGSTDSYFEGEISQVRLSSVIRYTSNFTPEREFTSDLSTHRLWNMNEGQGTTVNDSSASSQHGTIHNATWNGSCLTSSTVCVNNTLWEMTDMTTNAPCLGQYYRHAEAVSVCQSLGLDWSLPNLIQANALLATMSSTQQLNTFGLYGNGGGTCSQTQAGLNGVWWLSDHNGASAGSAIFCTSSGCYTTGNTMGDIYYYMVRCVRNGC